MAELTRISRMPPVEIALDQQELYARGLDLVRALARRTWTDHNAHDPGITMLEALSYALTDIAYRASFPIEDLLACADENAARMAKQFATARAALPARPLSEYDYRKLLIDLPGVKNAWLEPYSRDLYVDLVRGQLSRSKPKLRSRVVHLAGLYRVRIDFNDDLSSADKDAVLDKVRARLAENRNLNEDFVEVVGMSQAPYVACAELELTPEADLASVEAAALFRIQQYLSPAPSNYSLEEMLARKDADGKNLPVEQIFEGPALDCGFIPDEELQNSEIRDEIRLSDVICILMDIEGVKAVRDAVVRPKDTDDPLPNKWRVVVPEGKRPTLDRKSCRFVMHKRRVPMIAPRDAVEAGYLAFEKEARKKQETKRKEDLPIPLGTYRNPARYFSFQNQFPSIYGLGEEGLPAGADETRKALVYQLKAYLLFFDQILADDCATLEHLADFFSTDGPEVNDGACWQTYFHQLVTSFANADEIHGGVNGAQEIEERPEYRATSIERRSRFLDHLIARVGERFHDYDALLASLRGDEDEAGVRWDSIRAKCDFLNAYHGKDPGHGIGSARGIASARGLGYDAETKALSVWDTENVSGVERRVSALLGIRDWKRRHLGGEANSEGMLLIENMLLRVDDFLGPLLPTCVDPACSSCEEDDPYSYRVHVLLPAYAERFAELSFRRFAEEVIREEMPAHILPKICWVSREDMASVEDAYHDWLFARRSKSVPIRSQALETLIAALYGAKNVYPTEPLTSGETTGEAPKFVLSQTRLGSIKKPNVT